MIVWYKEKDMCILFSEMPKPKMRFVTPDMDEKEVEEINKKPFLNTRRFRVIIKDYKKGVCYSFTIPKDYPWDGASIPRLCWRLIGSNTDNAFLIPSLIHDILCENPQFINYDRYLSTCVLNNLLRVSKVPAAKRWAMKHSVDNYQKLSGKWRKKK